MLKHWLTAILSLHFLIGGLTAEGLVIKLDDFMPKLKLDADIEHPEFIRLSLTRGTTLHLEPGQPELPGYQMVLKFPADVSILSVGLEKTMTSTMVLDKMVYPRQPDIPLNGLEVPAFVPPDVRLYNEEKSFHHNFCSRPRLSAQGDSLQVLLTINPLALDSNGRRLSVLRSADLIVEYSRDRVRPTFSLLKTPGQGPYQLVRLADFLPQGEIPYLIITSETLAPQFDALAKWRTACGTPAVIRTVEWIDANIPGADLAEKIRNYIKAAWLYNQTRYVLLGGDQNIVPVRQVRYLDPYVPDGLVPSDIYYSDIVDTSFAAGFWDYNFNRNGNAAFGELCQNCGQDDGIDQTPDLFVGRAPVVDSSQAADFVSKVIGYETSVDWDQAEDVLIMADGSFAWFGEQAHQILAAAAPWASTYRMYNPQSGGYYTGQELLTVNSGLQRLSQGFGIVYHFDHGGLYALSLAKDHSSAGGGWIYRPQVQSLSNGPHRFIMLTPACSPNALDYSSIAKSLMNGPDGGAMAFIGNSRVGWSSQYPQFNTFFQALHQNDEARLGPLYNQMLAAGSPYGRYALNLLGDPGLRLYRRAPAAVSAIVPGKWEPSVSELTINLGPLAYQQNQALVVISQRGRLLAVKNCPAPGAVGFSYQEISTDTGYIHIAILARDHAVRLDSCYAASASDSAFAFLGLRVDDVESSGYGIRGNGDGVANPGEIIAIVPQYRGNVDSLRLSLNHPLAVLMDSLWPGLVSSESALNAGRPRFRVRIMPQFIGGQRLSINIKFYIKNVPVVTKQDEITVFSDSLQLISAEYLPALSTHSGRTSLLLSRAVIRNFGLGAASGVHLISEGEDVFLGDIPSGSEVTASQPLSINLQPSSGDTLTSLILRDHYGREKVLNLAPLQYPPAPQDVAAQTYDGRPKITWNHGGENVLGYNIYRRSIGEKTFYKINATPTTNRFYTDDQASPMVPYYYAVRALHANGRESPLSSEVLAAAGPEAAAGFPKITGLGNTASRQWTSPAAGDVDGDGKEEIILAGDDGRVYVWNHQGQELPGWPKSLGNNPYGRPVCIENSSPALADLDGEGLLDIIMGNGPWYGDVGDGLVHAWRFDGAPVPGWPQPVSGNAFAPAAAADLNGDGHPEVVAVSSSGLAYVWDHAGNLLPGWPLNVGATRAMAGAAIGNLDADSDQEIVIATNDAGWLKLWVFNIDGSPLPGWPLALQSGAVHVLSSPALADMDGDGSLEIVLGSERDQSSISYIYCLRADGTHLEGWPLALSFNSILSSPAISDLDRDGLPEIGIASGDGMLYSISHRSGPVINWSNPVPPNGRCSPVAADIDGDRMPDVLIASEDGYLRAFNGANGSPLPGFPIWIEPSWSAPLVSDIDSDGLLELAAYGWGGHKLYLWNLGAPLTDGSVEWSRLGCDHGRTGCYISGPARTTSPMAAANSPLPGKLPSVNILEQCYPNPSRGRVTIEYQLSSSSQVSLTIYNILGQVVRTLVSQNQSAGRHQVVWDLRDDSGRRVSAGNYFYCLSVGAFRDTKKVSIVK